MMTAQQQQLASRLFMYVRAESQLIILTTAHGLNYRLSLLLSGKCDAAKRAAKNVVLSNGVLNGY